MLNALKKHNAFVEARSFPHATHTYWSFDDRVALFNASAQFIEKHLGKPDATLATATPQPPAVAPAVP